MTTIAFTQLAAIIGLIAFSLYQQAQHAKTIIELLNAQDQDRARDREAHQIERAAWLADRNQPNPDITQLIGLTERLCQRLQAPTQAVIEHAQAQPLPPMPPTVNPAIDDSYWAAMQPKEQLADELMEHEVG